MKNTAITYSVCQVDGKLELTEVMRNERKRKYDSFMV